MSDKMRSEFEAWAHSENWCLAKDSNGIYIKVYVAFAYQAWQASRAALVVELPAWDEFDRVQQYSERMIESLVDSGVKYNDR